jgi:glycosyltransferase involved in cell wall biosynthesis
MNIAFDAKRLFHNHTGLGNYSRTLVKNLIDFYPQYNVSLLASNTSKSPFLNQFKSDFNVVDPAPLFNSYWRSQSIYRDINRLKPDIYHGLSNEIPFSSHKVKSRKIVTIHDLFYIKYPNDFTAIDRKIYKRKALISCQKADHIIAISQSTKQDIIEFLGVKPEKISVIYQSCNRFFQQKEQKPNNLNSLLIDNVPSEYALYVGSLNKRKNIIGLIKAFSIVPKEDRIPLVIVGSGSKSFTDDIHKLLVRTKLKKDIFLLGSITNKALKVLYSNAKFTCLPSFYEGFGIPVIESLFCNTPVLVGNNSSLVEAAGDCGIKCNPFDIYEIAQSIQKLSSDYSLLSDFQLNIPCHIKKFHSATTAASLHLLYSFKLF